MAHHALHAVTQAVPPWLIRAALTTLVGLLLTGLTAWGSHLADSDSKHETRISVLEDHQKSTDKSLDELKEGQVRMDKKLDRILEKL